MRLRCMISQVDLGAGASVSEDTTGYCATGSLSSSSRNNLPAACCRAISECELSLCAASGYRCYQSNTTHPHACTCGLTAATNLYSAGTSKACVSWQTNKANSRFDGEEMGIWTKFHNNSHARCISGKMVLTSKVWDGIKYPPHWVFVTVPLQSRSDFTSLSGRSLILMRVFLLWEEVFFFPYYSLHWRAVQSEKFDCPEIRLSFTALTFPRGNLKLRSTFSNCLTDPDSFARLLIWRLIKNGGQILLKSQLLNP